MRSKILLLLGPSGVGKTTLMRQLCHLDARFVPAKILVTRALRPSETEKECIDSASLDQMAANDQLIMLNELYGARYGTPKRPILDLLEKLNFPMLDWPVDKVEVMRSFLPNRTFTAYLAPPDELELSRRLAERGELDSERFSAACRELSDVVAGRYEHVIDLRVTSLRDQADELAQIVREKFLRSLEADT